MATGGSYLQGNGVRVQGTFVKDGQNTDPTTVTLKLRSPSGTVLTYTYAQAEITRSAVGVYYKEVPALTLNVVGKWWYRWIGEGAVAAAAEAYFTITDSRID